MDYMEQVISHWLVTADYIPGSRLSRGRSSGYRSWMSLRGGGGGRGRGGGGGRGRGGGRV